MNAPSLTFDAVSEDRPGAKWRARWRRSWPAYRAWFLARGGSAGPSRADCERALARHMPELVPLHRKLSRLAGDGDLEARFLSTWCPPPYLGGCSIASHAEAGEVRLVRNYDLSPDLNEGLLLRSAWTGRPVMGMVEFLWGLSDGINGAGLTAALAYGGRGEATNGFGVTTILRYVLETCASVEEALEVFRRVPSHMAYNITLADRDGATATVELLPGGGSRVVSPSIATNHQHGTEEADRPAFTRTRERRRHLVGLLAEGIAPRSLCDAFLEPPLYQTNYDEGFGTLFTAVYDPLERALTLRWPRHDWRQSLDRFDEGRRVVTYDSAPRASRPRRASSDLDGFLAGILPYVPPEIGRALRGWADETGKGQPDWASLARAFARNAGSCQTWGWPRRAPDFQDLTEGNSLPRPDERGARCDCGHY